MKMTMPEGLGLLGAVVVGMSLALGLPAAQLPPVSDSNEKPQQVPGAADDGVKDKPAPEVQPPSEQRIRNDTGTRIPRVMHVPPKSRRAITLLRRDARRLEIVQLPTSPEGLVTYKCRGGIKIVCKSQKFGTIRMEADEAVIKRVEHQSEEPTAAPKGETWIDEADLPMEVLLKGDVIFCQDEDKIAGQVDQRTIRAPQLDYDFVTGRVVSPPFEPSAVAARPKTPIVDAISSTTPQLTSVRAGRQRATSLFPRSAQRLQIRQLPETIPGVVTLVCEGGIKLVSESSRFGSFRMEANEAVIVRYLHHSRGETVAGPNGETWVEEDELPMEVHLKGDVIFRQDQGKIGGKGDEQTVRASRLDYDFATTRLVATDVEIAAFSASGLPTSALSASQIELRLVRKPDGSLARSEHRATSAEQVAPPKGDGHPGLSTADQSAKGSKP